MIREGLSRRYINDFVARIRRISLKKVLHAAEQDQPDVAVRRWR